MSGGSMPGFPCRILAFGALLAASLSNCSATELSTSLIDLVPSGAGLVAGLEARNGAVGSRLVFLPLPGKGFRDFDYFRSLCGADPSLSVKEVIFADDHLERDGYDHTLLARGRFKSEILLRSALSQGAVEERYRGLRVLRVPPLARERSEFDEFTWLVIFDSRILLLGSPEYVRQEIDRWIAKRQADATLREKFAALERDDVWWILQKPYNTSVVRDALAALDPSLVALMSSSANLCVGTRFARKVIFEYQTGVSEAPDSSSFQAATAESGHSQDRQFALLSANQTQETKGPLHGVIKVSYARYREWVSELATRRRTYR
jgi:hypothetical protein